MSFLVRNHKSIFSFASLKKVFPQTQVYFSILLTLFAHGIGGETNNCGRKLTQLFLVKSEILHQAIKFDCLF